MLEPQRVNPPEYATFYSKGHEDDHYIKWNKSTNWGHVAVGFDKPYRLVYRVNLTAFDSTIFDKKTKLKRIDTNTAPSAKAQ
ncbi:hypothetical protein GP486_005156 [Trichoglossum hirsutum]|uniref:Uncharacterized protein n=1 Tax=Trichoglossum hirsutum TaxID=265104 RepID=A0A9P8L9T3_9PEZI|nr:hypothetical protein GP486_005156 [Trichoglossum hirsutum]